MEKKIELSEAEIKFCEYQKGVTGNFFRTLIDAMFLADKNNQFLLSKSRFMI